MKFLPPQLVTSHIVPLNFIYDKGPEGTFGQDSLTIIFKDNDSGLKSSYTIQKPVIEAYFVKPEYRTFDRDLSHHWFPIDKCYKKVVPYASRFFEAAKELGLENSEQAKLNPYVYGIDIEIENFYLIQFIKEYPCHESKNISVGYFDIENDIIRIDHFPEYGETPINAVTYIDGSTKTAYTLILAKCDIPVVSEKHPMYAEYEDLRENWKTQMGEIRNHIPDFLKKIHQKYDENYPGFEYYLAFFDEEIELIQAFWSIAKECNNDFVYAWNLPYDAQNMMNRPGMLGYDVNEIIPDPKVVGKNDHARVSFMEDKNAKVAKRKHQCITWTLPTFLDQMVMYAGIRSGRGELASTKLNYIAQIELKDEKLDYSEDANIKTLFYRNLYKFIEYNLKDVLLQWGIETKTMDIQTIYSRMYDLFVTPSQSFTTTKVVLHALYSYALGKGFVLGQNRNKNHKNLILPKYGEKFANITEDMDEEEYMSEIFGGDEEVEENEDGTVKREKYAGAFVMNPLYINPTGVYVRGKPSKFIHDHVVDLDVTSEYPSAIIIGNISSETLIGRVFLEGELPTIKIPEMFEFRGDEAAKYKLDVSNFMLEQYSERDYISFCNTFLGLPTFSEVCDIIEKGA